MLAIIVDKIFRRLLDSRKIWLYLPKIDFMRFTSEFGVRAEKLWSGEVRVFRSITAAAAGLGVKPASVSYALKVGSTCKEYQLGRVPRLWAVRTVEDEYLVCRKDGERYVTLGKKEEVLYQADLMWSKEITESFYGK